MAATGDAWDGVAARLRADLLLRRARQEGPGGYAAVEHDGWLTVLRIVPDDSAWWLVVSHPLLLTAREWGRIVKDEPPTEERLARALRELWASIDRMLARGDAR